MDALPRQQVLDQIVAHIAPTGYNKWYVGITTDWDKRLTEHNVKDNGYIARRCLTNNDAREVEKALLNQGCDGGGGGGDNTSVYVYAYYKTASTKP